MSNQFIVLPIPSVSGQTGTPIDVSALGASKTIIVQGNDPIGLAVVEGSNDGTNFAPITNISLNLSPITIAGPFSLIRARRLAGNGSLSAVMGAEEVACTFTSLPTSGSLVDTSASGPVKTVVITGTWKGNIVIEGSNDDVHFDPVGGADTAGSIVIYVHGSFKSMRLDASHSSNALGLTATVGSSNTSSGSIVTGSNGVTVTTPSPGVRNATNDLVTGTLVAQVDAEATGNITAQSATGVIDLIANGGDIGLFASGNLTSLSDSIDFEVQHDNGGGVIIRSAKGTGPGNGDVEIGADRRVTIDTQDVNNAGVLIHVNGSHPLQTVTDGHWQAVAGADMTLTLQNDAGSGIVVESFKGGGAGNGDVNINADGSVNLKGHPALGVIAFFTGGSTVALAGGTAAVPVADVATGDFVILCRVTQGASPGDLSYTVTPTVGFVITSSSGGDNGNVDCLVVRPTV